MFSIMSEQKPRDLNKVLEKRPNQNRLQVAFGNALRISAHIATTEINIEPPLTGRPETPLSSGTLRLSA